MPITVAMRTQVSQLYVSLFGRAPDGEGLGFWVGKLDAGESFASVAQQMYATTPARVIYPTFLTNEEIVTRFYTNTLGRTPDAEGLAFWTAKLNVKGATVGSVIAEIITVVAGYKGTDAAGIKSANLFNNKVEVAQYYGEANKDAAGATAAIASVTDDRATVTAAKAAVDAPPAAAVTSTTLTTGLDNLTGGSGNDTFNGFVSGTANASTLTAGDQINGGAGTDTLAITIDSNTGANTMSPQATAVESITIRNLSDAANLDNLNMLLTSGVASVTLTNSAGTGDTEVTNAPLSVTYGISATPAAAAGGAIADLKVTYNAADVTGTADTAKFSVSGAGSKAATAGPDRATIEVGNTSGIEAVSVATSGTNFITVNGGGNDTKTVTITGDGTNNISVADLNPAFTLDASASTGANTFVLGALLTTGDTIRGGSGADILSISAGDGSSISISGVETLRVENGGTVGNLAFAAATTGVVLDNRDVGTNVLRFGNFQPTQISMVGADTATGSTFGRGTATNAVDFAPVRLDTAYAGANDTVTISLGNQGVANLNAYSATLNANAVENVVISQADTSVTNTNNYTLTIPGLKTAAITAASNVSLTLNTAASDAPGFSGTTSTAAGSTVSLIDFTGVTGTSSLTLGTSGTGTFAATAEVRASAGGTTITFGEEAATDTITFTGSAAADSVTAGAGGRIVANLGGGNDTFSASGISSTVGGSVTVDGGDGNDAITGSYAADSLLGGAGNDTLTGGLGADAMNGGDGNDQYSVSLGAVRVTGTAQVSTLFFEGIDNTDSIRVTIGSTTYTQPFATDAAGTVTAFVTNYAAAIRSATGGQSGITVTKDANANALIFTANTVETTASNGVVSAVGHTFTNPAGSVINTSSGATAGTVTLNGRTTGSVALADLITAGASEVGDVIRFAVSTTTGAAATSGTAFTVFDANSDGNITAADLGLILGGQSISGTTFTSDGTNLTINVSSTATTLPTVSYAVKDKATTATYGTATTVTTTTAITNLDAPTAGVAEVAATISHSNYTVSSTTGAITNNVDVITFASGDTISIGGVSLVIASDNDDTVGADISNTGIVTFYSTTAGVLATPASLGDALTLIATAISSTGGEVRGESAVFTYGGKTYLYVASGAPGGHTASDVVIEIVGVANPLVTGISGFTTGASGTTITNLG